MELIKITSTADRQLVSAKELYEFLGFNQTHWAKWYKKNIEANPFAKENEDWTGFALSASGNTTKDFVITLDFAKRLSMLARTEKGEQIRNYFIACEKKALELTAPKSEDQLLLEAMTILNNRLESSKIELEQANKTILIQAPKVQYVNEVLNSNSTHTTNVIALELGLSAQTLNKRLAEKGVQYYQSGTWQLAAKYRGLEYAKTKTHHYHDSEGKPRTSLYLVWTEKGRAFIHQLLNESLTAKNLVRHGQESNI